MSSSGQLLLATSMFCFTQGTEGRTSGTAPLKLLLHWEAAELMSTIPKELLTVNGFWGSQFSLSMAASYLKCTGNVGSEQDVKCIGKKN